MTTKIAALALLLALAIAPAVLAQEGLDDPAEQAYYRAFYLEKAVRSFEEAVKAYDRAAGAAPADRPDLRARSLLGRGRCLTALGRADEARKAFEEALRLAPESEEAKSRLEATREVSARDDELLDRISWLVNNLDQPAREQALRDLLLIGDRAVPPLAEALRSRSVGTAEGAATALAKIATEHSFAALAQGFRDEDVVFPKVLVNALNNIYRADRGGLEVFLAAMDHSRSEVRSRAISYLANKLEFSSFRGETIPATLAGILELALTDPAAETKAAALNLLRRRPSQLTGGGRDPIGNETWIALLRSEQPNVSWSAANALSAIRRETPWEADLCRAIVVALEEVVAGKRGSSTALAYLNGLTRTEDRAFSEDDLLALYEQAAASDRIDDDFRERVFSAVTDFLVTSRQNDRDALVALARKGWSVIRSPAGRPPWLAEFARLKSFSHELLLQAAGDPSPEVRVVAYRAIARLGEKMDSAGVDGALRYVDEDLQSGSRDVRRALLELLWIIRTPSAAPAIREFLAGNTDTTLQRNTLAALVRAAGEEALPEVRAALAGRDWTTARNLLVELLGVEAVPELIELAKRLESGSRPILATSNRGRHSLEVGPEIVTAYVAALPKEMRDERLVEKAAPAIPAEAREELVIDALGREDWGMLRAGARAAGTLHVERAWPYLIPLLDHPGAVVRAEATKALEAILSYRELKSSFERFGPGGAAQVLDDAIGLTKSEDPLKRRGGALALGALGDTAGIAVLLGLLEDEDGGVRDAAMAALERLGGRRDIPEDK